MKIPIDPQTKALYSSQPSVVLSYSKLNECIEYFRMAALPHCTQSLLYSFTFSFVLAFSFLQFTGLGLVQIFTMVWMWKSCLTVEVSAGFVVA